MGQCGHRNTLNTLKDTQARKLRGAASQQEYSQQTTHYGDNYNTASKHHYLLWKSIKAKLENLDVSHTSWASSQQQHNRPTDIEIIIQQILDLYHPAGPRVNNSSSLRGIFWCCSDCPCTRQDPSKSSKL